MDVANSLTPKRKDDRIIIHFDMDCFYASVFEAENPALKALPLAVQQKHIIVTCNYEARRRGLYKLQLISDAKKTCPDVIIVLGEDLTRFRDASKSLYHYLEAFSWNKKMEKLGFDEIFMDVTDIIDYNQSLLNVHDLEHSFFHLSKEDPTRGFAFTASKACGPIYPEASAAQAPLKSTSPRRVRHDSGDGGKRQNLQQRLILGSHLAQHLRHRLEEDKGYTATVGISTNKLLSKLVGNLNKPKSQTVLLPPYVSSSSDSASNVTTFIDSHDIGKIPGIGFKTSSKLRDHVLGHTSSIPSPFTPNTSKERVSVADVRQHPGVSAASLEKLLSGPGAQKGIGNVIWNLLHGIDNTEVKETRRVPSQISIEDSYIRLTTLPEVQLQLRILSTSLLTRMRTDLIDPLDPERWLAFPKTIRLSTRPRPVDGSRSRTFNRVSRSAPLPGFVFNLKESVDVLVEKLVQETLLGMFRRLHPGKGWNLSLLNIAVTNMVEGREGMDVIDMFKKGPREWDVEDRDVPPDEAMDRGVMDNGAGNIEVHNEETGTVEPSAGHDTEPSPALGSEDYWAPAQGSDGWDDEEADDGIRCHICGVKMPAFAMGAHEHFHAVDFSSP